MDVFNLSDDDALPAAAQGGTWLIGNFDGVHKGHQAMIAEVKAAYGEAKVLTFSPHPRAFFGQPLRQLTTLPQKQALLESFGVSALVIRQFDAAFAAHTAEAFIDNILKAQLGAQRVAVGADFKFGKGRAGDVALLRQFIPVHVFAPFVDEGGQAYSSTRIRMALEAGDAPAAEKLLGHQLPIG